MLNTFQAFWDCSLPSFSSSEHHIVVSVSVVEPIYHFFTGLHTEKSHILQLPGVSVLSYFIMRLHVWKYGVRHRECARVTEEWFWWAGATKPNWPVWLFFSRNQKKRGKGTRPNGKHCFSDVCDGGSVKLLDDFRSVPLKRLDSGRQTGIWQRLTRHPSLLLPLLKCRDLIPPAWGGDPQGAPDPRADQPGHSEGTHRAHVPPEAHHGHAQVRETHTVLFWR